MKDLVIVGAGGHGREMLQLVQDINAQTPQWNVLGFADDTKALATEINGYPVLGTCDWLTAQTCSVIVAIGTPAARRSVVQRLERSSGLSFASLVHPSAQIGSRVQLGEGAMVCAAAVLTTDIVTGRHVLVNTGAVVSHDCQLDDFVTLAPRVCVCGGVMFGEGADIGAGSTLLPRVRIAQWATVGAGATVVQSVEANATVVGVPTRVIKVRPAAWQDKDGQV